jgi:uncharacterized damage-inducible protein DinB
MGREETAMLDTIRLFCDYTAWADARMFEAMAALTPEQWTRDLGGSMTSVRDTAVHLAGAEWLYLSRFRGVSPKANWNPADFPGPAALREKWAPVAADLCAFAAARTEEGLRAPLSYLNLKGEPVSFPLGQVILQVTNHSTYHRGQVASQLRQVGATPRSTDLILYCMERAKPA